jgi:hypothetical protein
VHPAGAPGGDNAARNHPQAPPGPRPPPVALRPGSSVGRRRKHGRRR